MKKHILMIGIMVFLVFMLIGLTVVPNLPVVQTKMVFEDVVAKTINSVVHIRNNTGRWQGSGVIIAPDLILTARHVVEGGTDFDVMTNDGKIYKATRAISSKKYDLGFIKLDEPVGTPTRFGDIKDCHLGQSVYAIGSPYGDINFNSVTLGIISSLKRDLEKFDCPKEMGWSVTFQTDTNGEPGNSGCPVFTMDGIVRGILVGGFSNGIIYCVPTELVVNDCQMIQLMFAMDNYEKEIEEVQEEYSYTSKGGY